MNLQRSPLFAALAFLIVAGEGARAETTATLATFAVDVTIPVGHPCMGGGVSPAQRVSEPLQARGFVLTVPAQRPWVVVSFDWCEIRGSAFDDWRAALVDRLHAAMLEAWAKTQRHPLRAPTFRVSRIPLGARDTADHTEALLRDRLAHDPKPFARAHAAMGLAWYERVKSGHRIELPAIDFGPAQLLLLPAESYVEFQLYAQSLRPESFVLCLGYGECGPGYIPIERAWSERDSNLRDWTWVGPGSENPLRDAIREVLAP